MTGLQVLVFPRLAAVVAAAVLLVAAQVSAGELYQWKNCIITPFKLLIIVCY